MQSGLDAGHAVRDLREVVSPELLLPFHAKRTMVGRDHLQIVVTQTTPEMIVVMLRAQRRRANELRAFKLAFTLPGGFAAQIVFTTKEILRAGLGVSRQSAIARFHHA